MNDIVQLRFPEELPTDEPIILFEAKEWSMYRLSYKDDSDTNYKKESKGSVALYLPVINETHNVVWDSAQQVMTHAANTVVGVIEALPLGKIAVDYVKLKKSVAVSQDSIATFKDVENREFSFSFTLMPSSQSESRVIKTIIDFFRYHSLPEYSAVLINFPSIFYVTVLNIDDGSGNGYFQFKPMALKSLNVTYGDGEYMQLMTNNTPSKVKLELSFQEVTKPYKGDFKYSDSRMKVTPTNQKKDDVKTNIKKLTDGASEVTE